MTTVIVSVTVEDLDRFEQTFRTRGYPLRRRHGSTSAVVLHDLADPLALTLVFRWSSREAFEGFLADPEVQASMKASGAVAPPQVRYLEEVLSLDA
ncbi:MAG TPA: antibiotic biosynthesis monooxygenase [Baekduia sp.]|nr:antibiotic biosynthesis monooxygenase [Baekduia sp.]